MIDKLLKEWCARRLWRGSIAAVLLLASWPAVAAADYQVTIDGVVYTWDTDANGYYATGWDEVTPIRDLCIHSVVADLDVVGVADGAFNFSQETGNYTEKAVIESLVIEDGVETIGANAFIDCTYLKSATIPASVTTIGDAAFFRCSALNTLLLSEGLTRIEDEAFAECASLTSVVIPSSVQHIGSEAFLYCTSVTDVWFLMTETAALNAFGWWDGVLPHGGTEFNTPSGTTLHVPQGMRQAYIDSQKFTAWLSAIDEDDNVYPLWWIVNYGVVGRSYTVSDDLTAVYADRQGALYCKDDNRWLTPDVASEGERNYMVETGFLAARCNVYDQSNWVAVEGLVSPDAFKGYKINGGTITGVLRDKINPVIEVSEAPVKGAAATYVPNTYIPASLMSRTQVGANDGKTYAFVRPKPQEYAKYEWTIYSDNNEFYVPAPEAGVNVHAIKGGLKADMTLLENATVPSLQSDGNYPFDAITRRAVPSGSAGAPRAWRVSAYTEGGLSDKFLVMPLHLPTSPVTCIDDISAAEPATVTTRYNLLGQPVGKDYRGIVIENGRLIRY